jgi:SpoVK/Ycf46/Vps4 family AAA+-type ATPase
MSNDITTGQKFNFKDLKIHGTNEWLYNSQKRYRQVFEQSKLKYIYVELSLYNLLFMKSDWNVTVNFKVFDESGKNLCDNSVTQTIKSVENISNIRYSWGTPDIGKYWTKGTYRWEAWIDGTMIGSKYFYILGDGEVTSDNNPYFSLNSVKLYEGPLDDIKYGQRKYLKTFNCNTTRYIWIEFEADNHFYNISPISLEIFFKIRNDIGESIGEITDFFTYPASTQIIRFSRGWGSKDTGNWYKGIYTLDVVFLDKLLGTVKFNVSEIEEEDSEGGKFEVITENEKPGTEPVTKELTEEEVLKELNEMIGLATIKESIKDFYDYLKFVNIRKAKGLSDSEKISLHAVFTGNPGTGKTKTALLLGKIYKNLGLLSKGHVYEVDRGDLCGEYIGQTAPKTKEAIKKAKGGILFIDEAYSLAREGDSEKDYGKEALEIILKEMSDGEGDLAVIVAGYPQEMEFFLNSNPGLKSRFKQYFNFPDYTPKELLEIGNYYSGKIGVTLNSSATDFLYKKLVEAFRNRDKTFGNARYVNSIVDEAKMNMGLRIIEENLPVDLLDAGKLSTITEADIIEVFKKHGEVAYDLPVDEELLRESLKQLNTLVGINNIKTEISDIVKLVRYFRDLGKDVRKVFSLHSVFTGNPGTGKTTVARILAKIYKALGILERGHLVETDREGMVGGYVGQTALKSSAIIDKAMGGVLFIDEAYALVQPSENDFGQEAVEILLKRMEDKRGEFIVICAGYTGNMEGFLESNPGLKSRFDRKFHFNDYSEEELLSISKIMFGESELKMDDEAQIFFINHIKSLCSKRDKFFGNAREIRKSVEQVVLKQNLRLAELPKKDRNEDLIHTVTLKDVEKLPTDIKEKSKFGFT